MGRLEVRRGVGPGVSPGARLVVRLAVSFLAVAALWLPSSAGATPITLSSVSSDETPASLLDATFDFSVAGSTLTLVATNDTASPDAYNINQVYFNASAAVTGLTLTSATHSAAGDVTSEWLPMVTDFMVDGFGDFDFGLREGVGETSTSVIGPSESVTFVFTIGGAGPFSAADFIQPNAYDLVAAAKFVNGPYDDSAFGAVPEPSTALLLAAGLLLLGAQRRSFRR